MDPTRQQSALGFLTFLVSDPYEPWLSTATRSKGHSSIYTKKTCLSFKHDILYIDIVLECVQYVIFTFIISAFYVFVIDILEWYIYYIYIYELLLAFQTLKTSQRVISTWMDGIRVFFSARIEHPSVVEMFSVEAGFRNGSTESEDMVCFFLQIRSVTVDIWLISTWGSRFKGHWVPVCFKESNDFKHHDETVHHEWLVSLLFSKINFAWFSCSWKLQTLSIRHPLFELVHFSVSGVWLNATGSVWAMKLLEDTQLLHGIKIKEPFLQLTWQTLRQVVSLNVTWDLPSSCHPGNQSQTPEKWLCQKNVSVVSKVFFSIASCQSSKKQHLQSSKISNLQNLNNRNSRYKSEISRTNKWTNLSF